PFKGIYTLLAVMMEVCRLPLWIILYTPRGGRPRREWTMRQALGVRFLRSLLYHLSNVETKQTLSLHPGPEGNRFAIIEPGNQSLYVGPCKDEKIKPQKIGGTWYPSRYESSDTKAESEDVLLHVHGGAFIVGDGREKDAGYLCRTLMKRVGFQYAFAPQYRLASNPGCRFPAQVQDTITAYSYLINTLHIPPHRVTVSGDSAGATLVLALLRYIQEHGEEVGLPPPACAFLWSPWVNIETSRDPTNILRSPHYNTDYLTSGFGGWGARAFAGGLDATQPYISPVLHPFATPVPMFVQTGGAEVLCDDNIEVAKKLGSMKGNVIEIHVEPYAPHDIALVGNVLGFSKEFDGCAEKAREFFVRNR
ncbi:alpha/beta-hydrolase, partial [Rhizodiscina lignyota]